MLVCECQTGSTSSMTLFCVAGKGLQRSQKKQKKRENPEKITCLLAGLAAGLDLVSLSCLCYPLPLYLALTPALTTPVAILHRRRGRGAVFYYLWIRKSGSGPLALNISHFQ